MGHWIIGKGLGVWRVKMWLLGREMNALGISNGFNQDVNDAHTGLGLDLKEVTRNLT